MTDPQSQICFTKEYDSSFDYYGASFPCSLTVIEWSTQKQRALMLCGNDDFTMNSVPARIHVPGFSFTAEIGTRQVEEVLLLLNYGIFS
jgi:hypothetical protein